MKYVIVFKKSALKELQRLPRNFQRKVNLAVNMLKENICPNNSKKLNTKEPLYSLRIGDYRVIYHAQKQIKIVMILKVGHRKNIYRLL